MSKIPAGGPSLTRRQVLIGALFAGGSLLVGGLGPATLARGAEDFAAFGPFLRFAPDGTVTVVSKHSEMGQGAQSGLAAIVAEELDADWSRVRVEMAPANLELYRHTVIRRLQITGGSSSISNSWDQLRRVGASARAMFVTAAAREWQAPAGEIQVAEGVVSHPGTGRQATFGSLLSAASRESPPVDPALKTVEEFKLIGTERVHRLDARAKSTGGQTFTLDVQELGLLTALVAHSPRFGGRVKSFDATDAKAISGVVDVFEIPTGVAVVADNFYAASKGRDALVVDWDDSGSEMRSSEEIHEEHRAIGAGDLPGGWVVFAASGDVDPEIDNGIEFKRYEFDFPYLAHTTMEPMNCVAQVDGTKVRLRYGAQSQTADQQGIAAIVGCPPEEVEIETLHCGGSFGRRSVADADYQKECVHIAKHIGGGQAVKLVWTREDDMKAGYYRPIVHHALAIAVDEHGYPALWRQRLVAAPLMAGTRASPEPVVEIQTVEGVQDNPYLKATQRVRAEVAYTRSPITVNWLRSVGHTHTAMAMEHSIDRLARAADIDPAAYRQELYRRADAKRHLGVLALAIEKSAWAEPIEEGWARGIAVHESYNSVVANVAEVQIKNGIPIVRRVVVVSDCGIAISPDQIRAQMEGGVNYGLSLALFGEVVIEKGIVQTTNFHNYRVLRMAETPLVETHVVPSANPPTGTGEPGTPVIAPAVANALLALTGKATERLPFVRV